MRRILLGAVILLTLALAAALRHSNALAGENRRLRDNQTALLRTHREYKLRDSLNALSVGVLTLKADEFRRGFEEMEALVRDMNVKLKRVENISQTALEGRYDIAATLKDTLVVWTGGRRNALRAGAGDAAHAAVNALSACDDTHAGVRGAVHANVRSSVHADGLEAVHAVEGDALRTGAGNGVHADVKGGVPANMPDSFHTTALNALPAAAQRDVAQANPGDASLPAAAQSDVRMEPEVNPPSCAEDMLRPARALRFRDAHMELDGLIIDSVFLGSVVIRDTLTQVVHRIPRRFLFIRWGVKELRQEIVSSNPHTRIIYNRTIRIRK